MMCLPDDIALVKSFFLALIICVLPCLVSHDFFQERQEMGLNGFFYFFIRTSNLVDFYRRGGGGGLLDSHGSAGP